MPAADCLTAGTWPRALHHAVGVHLFIPTRKLGKNNQVGPRDGTNRPRVSLAFPQQVAARLPESCDLRIGRADAIISSTSPSTTRPTCDTLLIVGTRSVKLAEEDIEAAGITPTAAGVARTKESASVISIPPPLGYEGCMGVITWPRVKGWRSSHALHFATGEGEQFSFACDGQEALDSLSIMNSALRVWWQVSMGGIAE